MEPKIKCIIFDVDGVIDDNYEEHYRMSQKQIIDITREEHRQLFEGNIHEQREKIKERDTGYDIKTHFSNYKKDQIIKPNRYNSLLRLYQTCTLGIITSAKEEGTFTYLRNNNLADKFAFVYGFETDKSKINKFRKAMNEFNLAKEEIVFVTDTLGDILEANQVGIKTIAVDFGYHERSRLKRGNPYKIVSSFENIVLEILKM